MKRVSDFALSLLTVLMTMLSAVAFAATGDENPYKNHYVKEAQAIRKQGTAKVVYQFMTRDNRPLPGVIMLYNTTQAKGQEGVADENGMVIFEVKDSEVFFIHHIIFGDRILPVQGGSQVNMVEKLDIRKGTVFWNCIVQYGNKAFMSYRGN
ncbi:MAG: hypothetical protein IJV12_08570 [Acidaminococcaceae bacterium]|nr:hypothetical protein [Acidaminococcaceae bacterium]